MTARPARALHAAPAVGVSALAIVALAACGASTSASHGGGAGGQGSSGTSVTAGDNTCKVSTTTLQSGRHTFTVRNSGSQITEVYVYAAGDQIMGEVENVGPSTTRTLLVDLPPGSYQVACKPGMTGTGIRTTLTVTGQSTSAAPANDRANAAVASYRRYIATETQSLLDSTTAFATAVKAGDAAQARELYPQPGVHYERIEPIAESFGTLDPLIDMRVDDATAGTPFVGFHRLERDLFQSKNIAASGPTADALLANVRTLKSSIPGVTITPLTMANGAKSLLDEVAKSKVTGEEERYSRIDLVDFQANVEGSKYAYTALRPIVAERNPTLAATLDKRFASLLALLATHQAAAGQPGSVPGSGFVSYDRLSPADVKALAVEVDTISEPLGQLAGVVAAQ